MRAWMFVVVIALVSCASNESSVSNPLGGAGQFATFMPPTGGVAAPGTAGTGAAATFAAPQGGTGGWMAAAGVSGAAGAAAGSSGTGVGGVGGAAATAAAGSGGAAGAAAAGGSAGGSGAAGGAGGASGGAPGTVTVSFTTVTYAGQYAPRNYGAVWFETASGMFIKTAKRWAGVVHASDLATWTEASGGWGSILFPGNMADQMDAVSLATIRTHEMHTVTWNMMNSTRQVVPDGEYVAVLEMSESRALDRNGPVVRIPFTKGPNPQNAMAPDQEGFMGVVLQYQP